MVSRVGGHHYLMDHYYLFSHSTFFIFHQSGQCMHALVYACMHMYIYSFVAVCVAPALAEDSALGANEKRRLCEALTADAAEPGTRPVEALRSLVRNINTCYAQLG